MPEERKLVTVLFADIVGSTALGEAEEPELVGRTLGRAFAHIREQLEAHGGTVVAKRRARAEELLRQCDEVTAR